MVVPLLDSHHVLCSFVSLSPMAGLDLGLIFGLPGGAAGLENRDLGGLGVLLWGL